MPAGRLCPFRTNHHLHCFNLWQRPVLICPLATARRLHELRASRQCHHWQLHSWLSQRTNRLRLSRQYRRVVHLLQHEHSEFDGLVLPRKQCWCKMPGYQVASLLESAATLHDNRIWSADNRHCSRGLIEYRRDGCAKLCKSSWSDRWADCCRCGRCCSGCAASTWSSNLPGSFRTQAQEGEEFETGNAISPPTIARTTHRTHRISTSKTVSSASSNDISIAWRRTNSRHDCTRTTNR